jgi:FAD/FMN-containing dehydrogenase
MTGHGALASLDIRAAYVRRTPSSPQGRPPQLRQLMRGRVYEPGDDGYDEARRAWNPRVDPRPALVAEAYGAADVRLAVAWARTHDMPISVQSTGHGTRVARDGGLLIKTSRMTGVLIDPERRTVRVGPGTRWGAVVDAAAPLGLAPLSGSSTDVGVAGYALGGGLAWLSRKYGYAADSLLRADVVTADGQQVTASRDSHQDLFWALRGGGANFGIVTSLEFRLFPVSTVYAGIAYFPVDRALSDRAAQTLARYREFAVTEPDELTTAVMLVGDTPAGTGPALAIRALYTGTALDARRALRPLFDAAGPPVLDGMREMSFAQTRTVPVLSPGNLELAAGLSDELIGDLITAFSVEATSSVEVRHWGGAMAQAGQDAGPVGHRDVPFSVVVNGPAEAAALVRGHATGGSFLNFQPDVTRTESAYTPADYRRLRDIKRDWDPDNVLGFVHNIPPATPPATRRR